LTLTQQPNRCDPYKKRQPVTYLFSSEFCFLQGAEEDIHGQTKINPDLVILTPGFTVQFFDSVTTAT
jgi:hypothetical protein